jgi:aspartate aminotransferase-like enzyme
MVVDSPHDRPLDLAAVETALGANPDLRWLFYISHETRAGLVNPMVEIGRLGKRHGLVVAADVVSSAFAYPIDLEGAGLDLAVTSSAKAIMGVPGLAMVFVRLAALPALRGAHRPRGYYLDLVAETDKQRQELAPRFAQPVALHAALRAACLHLKQVSPERHMQRIRAQMEELTAHLEALGAPAQLPPQHRSWIATNFRLPRGLEYPDFARRLEAEGYYVLYGIPGDLTHFQLSTIGDLAPEHVSGMKAALSRILA